MRKKTVKLVLAAAMLAGSLGVGVAPRAASAIVTCPPMCCNARCTSIRQCFPSGSGCICKELCEFAS
jgi:hypothetical protein